VIGETRDNRSLECRKIEVNSSRNRTRLIEKLMSEFPDIGAARAQRIVEIYIEHMQERALQARKQTEERAIDREQERL
jgi:hypothetical protein